jgi:hypothetical protein
MFTLFASLPSFISLVAVSSVPRPEILPKSKEALPKQQPDPFESVPIFVLAESDSLVQRIEMLL